MIAIAPRKHPSSCTWPNERGFTIAESLVSCALVAIVFLAIYGVYDIAIQDSARGTARADVQQNIRVALESLARELRTSGYSPSSASTTGCTATAPVGAVTALATSPVSVTFQVDSDGNNCTDQIIYMFVPPPDTTRPCDASDASTIGRLTRSLQTWDGSAWNPATPVAYDVAQCVTALTLTYYDASGATTTTPANVRRVGISITASENIRGYSPRIITLSSDVRLRNLGQ